MPPDDLIPARSCGRAPGDSVAVPRPLPDGILAIDRAGIIIACNPAAEALLAWPPGMLAGQPETVLGLRDDSGRAVALTEAAAQGRRLELPATAPDGRAVAIEVAGALVDPDRVVVVLRDGDGRRAVQAALVEAEARLAGISANLPGIVFRRLRCRDGHISYPFVAEGVRDVLGFAPDELRVNAEGCLDVMHWADRERHRGALLASAAALTRCEEAFRAITRWGEVRWLSGSSRPQRLPDGGILWDGVLLDVTDRKRAEIRLELIMDHAADSIITLDEAGSIESFNAAAEQTFGYRAAEVVGEPLWVLMPEAQRAGQRDRHARHAELGEAWLVGDIAQELSGRRKDGSAFPFELSTSEVRMEGRRLFICIGRDITQRRQTEEALHESELRLSNIAANLPGLVFQRVLTPDGRIRYTYVSEGTRDLMGIEPDQLVADGDLLVAAMVPEHRDPFLAALYRSAETLEPLDEEFQLVAPGGARRWLRGRSRPRPLASGVVAWDGVTLDVTERKEAEERLRFQAYYDPVTGVANRTRFLECFSEARPVAQRKGHGLAVLCLGVDRFAVINSTLGHAVGDEVLAGMAERLEQCADPDDVVARAGGDRFLMLLTGIVGDRHLAERVERIQLATQQPLRLNGEEFDLSASIGVSLYPRDGEDAETIVRHADAALLRAKAGGPASVQSFSEEMGARALKTLSLQARLRRALANDEVIAYYQPQVDIASGRIVGMEALARWISPELGMISPAEFIPVAEEYGLIDTVCEHVLRHACRQVRAWQGDGLAAVPVAVNVSGRQFQHSRRLVQALQAVLRETALEPCFLEIELTESSAMRDADNAIAVVAQLNDMGLACAIDDFGTGYSSLSVLKRFPIQKLKIDRSFVMDITTDANDAAIVKAIIAMAHALRLKVVAEGVELAQHLDFLRQAGCDQIQGYLFSRPVPAEAMRRLIAEGHSLAAVAAG